MLHGIDKATYYRLVPEDKRYYLDFTGCGSTLTMQSPQVLRLIMDSLRYWVLEMHVDGFRFDLALPAIGHHTSWVRILDTIAAHVEERRYPGGATYPLQGRTLALFVLTAERRTEGADEPAECRS